MARTPRSLWHPLFRPLALLVALAVLLPWPLVAPRPAIAAGLSATVSPTVLAFGDQPLGTVSDPLSFTLTNAGEAPLAVLSHEFVREGEGFIGDYYFHEGECFATGLAPRASCTVQMRFLPSIIDDRAGMLRIYTGAPGTDVDPTMFVEVALTGRATEALDPLFDLSATQLDFGTAAAYSSGATKTLTVSNRTAYTIWLDTAGMVGSGASDFALDDRCSLLPIAPGEACEVAITFTPYRVGPIEVALGIGNGIAGQVRQVQLTGSAGAAATVEIEPGSLDFGSVVVGQSSAPQPVTVRNTSNSALFVSNVALSGWGEAAGFALGSDTCRGNLLPANASCQVEVRFAPGYPGFANAELTFAINGVPGPLVVGLGGFGEGPIASSSPTILAFQEQPVGTASAPQRVLLHNTGTMALTVSRVVPSDNAFQVAVDGCTGVAVAPDASCSLEVRFAPGTPTAYGVQLQFYYNAPYSPWTIELRGTGTGQASAAPVVVLEPASLTFAPTTVGAASQILLVTVRNTGTAPLAVRGVGIGGSHPGDFAIWADNCSGQTVEPGQVCQVGVLFRPTAAGARDATLRVIDGASVAHGVSLAGTGVAPTPAQPSLAPTGLSYPSQTIGTTSAAQLVRVTNLGETPFVITSATIGGPHAADFAVAFDNLDAFSAIDRNTTATLGITFTPSATGTRTAVLTVNTDAPGGPFQVQLTGLGASASALVPSPQALDFGSVTVGTMGTVQTVTLRNTGGVAATVTGAVIGEAQAGDFAIADDRCMGTTLAPDGTCTVGVRFAPTAPYERNATLQFTADAPGLIAPVSLRGEGGRRVFTLTIAQAAGGNLQVRRRDGLPYSPATLAVPEGSSVTVEAVPGNGYTLTAWLIDGREEHPLAMNRTVLTTYSISLSADRTISAIFTAPTSPAPVLTGVSPGSAQVGAGGTTLTVTGSGFVGGSTVHWNGAPLATTFVSPTQLAAAVTAANLAAEVTAEIAVVTPAPGGGRSAPRPFFVTAAATIVTAVQSATGTGGTTTVAVGGAAGTAGSVSATATGSGTITVAQYAGNPGGTVFGADERYMDVHVTSGSSFSEITIVNCDLNGATIAYWWNGTVWAHASDQTYHAETGCITIVVGAATSPNLGQLGGTYFAVAAPPMVCLRYDPAKPISAGSAATIKVQLCDGQGNNRSAPGWTLTATDLSGGKLDDAGKANPNNRFRFDPTLGGTGGYLFTVNTKGLKPGTYVLHFTINGGPQPYEASFRIK